MSKEPRDQELTFEACYERLQEIVQALEEGERSLDESIALYEEGMGCLSRCIRLLDEAEKKIQMLVPDEEGKPTLVDYETGESTGEDGPS